MQGLSLVTLGVADVARSRRFYEALGWHAHPGSEDAVCFFQNGSMIVALWSAGSLAEDSGVTGGRPGAISLARNVGSKDEVDSALAHAAKCGAKILKPAHDTFWGGYSGYFADPDGHPWEVAWNPFWTLSASGAVSLPE